MKQREKIILFDGLCGLCHKSINLLIKLDTQKIFRYTSLQGEFVQKLTIEPGIDSIIFYEDGSVYYKSTAILKILRSLGGVWILTQFFYIIPRIPRDFIYDVIAKYRYKIFGKMQSCPLPKEEEGLFLD